MKDALQVKTLKAYQKFLCLLPLRNLLGLESRYGLLITSPSSPFCIMLYRVIAQNVDCTSYPSIRLNNELDRSSDEQQRWIIVD